MNNDKNINLKDFLKLLENPSTKYTDGYEDIHSLLSNFFGRPNVFWLIYENLEDKQKPDLANYDNPYFIEMFFNLIKKLDNESFNKYFFSGLHENKLLNISDIRIENAKREGNKELNEYLEYKDKPKSIDQIIDKVIDLYNNNQNKFCEYINKNKESIKKINNIKAKKSRAVSYLTYWLVNMQKKNDFKFVINIAEQLELDLFKISKNTGQKLDIRKINLDDIKGLGYLFNKYPNEKPYVIIKTITNLSNIFDILNINKDLNNNIDYIKFFWSIYKEEMTDKFSDSFKMTYKKEGNSIEILRYVINDTHLSKKIGSYYQILPDEQNKIFKTLEMIELKDKLNENSHNHIIKIKKSKI